MRTKSLQCGKLLPVLIMVLILVLAISCTPTATPTPTQTTTPPAPTTSTAVPSTSATVPGSPSAPPSTSPPASTSPAPSASPAANLGSVEVLGIWGSSELTSFQAMIGPWQQQTGGTMNFTGTRDLTAVLTTRIRAGNPPDIAILPNPGLMKQFAGANNLKPLNPMLDMNTINQQYPSSWVTLGTVNNNLYALFMKAANKSMVWYNPKTFTANGWQTPGTWDDLITLSNQIVSDKKVPANPWSVGVESSASSGWPATDWISQIFLSKYGGDAYDQWVNHDIPWTDAKIKDAWTQFGTIVTSANYVPGGLAAILATNFQNAAYLPFQNPPKAAMYYEGDFIEGFITTQFPTLVAGQDFNYFPFPDVSQQYKGAVTGGADLVCAFKDTPTVRSFISYMSTPQAQSIWVKRGGFTSVNKQVSPNDYPDPIARQSAQQLVNASLFRFGAGDSMPGAVQTAWWAGVQQYLQNPNQLNTILANIESQAVTAYGH